MSADRTATLRIGVINLMPERESYEPLLRAALPGAELAFVQLRDQPHPDARTQHGNERGSFAEIQRRGALDGLVLTGAPPDATAFEEQRFWPELSDVLRAARASIPSTLGLCWGGLALAQLLGIGQVRLRKKLFGSYPLIALEPSPLMPPGEPLWYAQSRRAGVHVGTLESAVRGRSLRVLAYSELFGYSVFESADGRYLMHLGHPEYTPSRLVEEYQRERGGGANEAEAPHGVDLEQPERGHRTHGPRFFAHWLEQLARARAQA